MVRCWLLNSMDAKISDNFAFVDSVFQLWTELVERFGKTNGPMLFQLRRTLMSICQGAQSVGDYYSAIKKMWNEIAALEKSPQYECGAFLNCSCELVKKVLEKDARYQLIEFLMGLNSEFDTVRSTILTTDPLPPVNKAFYLVEQVERKKLITNSVNEFLSTDSMVCSVNSQNSRRNSSKQKSERFCEHCKVKGHSKERCYKLIGYPKNWKFKNGEGPSKQANTWRQNSRGANYVHHEDNPLELPSSANLVQQTSLNQETISRMCQEVARLIQGGEGTSGNSVSANFAGPYL